MKIVTRLSNDCYRLAQLQSSALVTFELILGCEKGKQLPSKVSKVKLYIAPVKPASEGDGVFSGACRR